MKNKLCRKQTLHGNTDRRAENGRLLALWNTGCMVNNLVNLQKYIHKHTDNIINYNIGSSLTYEEYIGSETQASKGIRQWPMIITKLSHLQITING